MSTRFYSVYDKAAGRYLDPFTAPTDAVAQRGFSDAVNREGHPFNLHPEDYVLVVCGSFDPESGKISPEGPEMLVAGYQLEALPSEYESPYEPLMPKEEETDAN